MINQIIITINGDYRVESKKNQNTIVISNSENVEIDQNYTLLQTNFTSIDDLIKAEKIIKKQLIPIHKITIVNKNIDLNMLSYQYDYKFIKDNYLILANIIFFLNLLISNFDKDLKIILSIEKKNHYKVHVNNFNEAVINYLDLFKKDLKGSYNITIKKLN